MEWTDWASAKSRMIQLPELRLQVFSQLFNRRLQRQPDLLHVALVSRDFCENALSVLWEDIELQMLFGLLMLNGSIIKDDSGAFHFADPFDVGDLHRFQQYSRRVRVLRATCTTRSGHPLFNSDFLINWTAFLNAAQHVPHGPLSLGLLPGLRVIRWVPDKDEATTLACVLLLPMVSGRIRNFQLWPPMESEPRGLQGVWCSLLSALHGSARTLKRLDLGRSLEGSGLTAQVRTHLCNLLPLLEVEELGISDSVFHHADVMGLIASSPRVKRLMFYASREDQALGSTKTLFPEGGFANVTHLITHIVCLNALFRPYGTTFRNLSIVECSRDGDDDYFPSNHWSEVHTSLQYIGAQCPALKKLNMRCRVSGGPEAIMEDKNILTAFHGCSQLSFFRIDLQTDRENDGLGCPKAYNPSDDDWLQLSKGCPALNFIHYTVRDPWYAQGLSGDEAFQPRPQATLLSLFHILTYCPLLATLRIPFIASGVIPELQRGPPHKLKVLNVEQAWEGLYARKLAAMLVELTEAADLRYTVARLDRFEEEEDTHLSEFSRTEYWGFVAGLVQSMREARQESEKKG